jgi:hypothetical protein
MGPPCRVKGRRWSVLAHLRGTGSWLLPRRDVVSLIARSTSTLTLPMPSLIGDAQAVPEFPGSAFAAHGPFDHALRLDFRPHDLQQRTCWYCGGGPVRGRAPSAG